MGNMADIHTVACIGAGNVGRAWAIVFARAGLNVRLFDVNPDVLTSQALPSIRQSLEDLEAAGQLASVDETLARIRTDTSLRDAVTGACYVQESIREDLATKREVFETLGQMTPATTILASSTSAIPGSKFMEHVAHPERCVIAHPVNPPYLIPLVEICASPWTSPDTTARCRAFLTDVGQKPVVVNKEIQGFILNRLQFTLLAEALHLVGEGYCSPEDIDATLKHGLAMRWAFIGPFEVGHLNSTQGFQGYVDNLGAMMRSLAADAKVDYDWGQPLAETIHEKMCDTTPAAEVPQRQAWRDRRIMALRNHLRDAASELGD